MTTEETTPPTPDQLLESVNRAIAAEEGRIAGAQGRIRDQRGVIAGARARIAELKRMLPRKPRTRKPKADEQG